MGKCAIFIKSTLVLIILLLIAVAALYLWVSPRPRPSSVGHRERYRPDYKYNAPTDAYYKVHKKRLPVESREKIDAKTVCEAEGAALLVYSPDDVGVAFDLIDEDPSLGQDLWVAPVDRSKTDERQNYGDRQSRLCKALTQYRSTRQLPCDQELPFICKVEGKDAPKGSNCGVAKNYQYELPGDSCYRVSRWTSTWDEAYSECRTEGAHLVILNSEAEKDVVHALMKASPELPGAQNPHYYFAGFRANKPVYGEAVFNTIFNETLEEAGYARWSYSEPNNYLGTNEYCGSLFDDDGKLNDVTCEHQYGFICEMENRALV